MVKDMGIIIDSAPHHKSHKAESHKEVELKTHKSGLYVQTRRDTTGPISGEPDYIHPDDWPVKHIELLNKIGG